MENTPTAAESTPKRRQKHVTAHQNRDANAEGLPHTTLGDNAVEQTHHIGLTRSEPEPQHKGHDKKRE